MRGNFGALLTSRLFIVEADGGSRGNPGKAGSGAVVFDANTGEVLVEVARFIGIATNNVAEYLAIIAGVEQVLLIEPAANIRVRMDSKLVVEQMSGRWKIKHPDMQQLAANLHEIIRGCHVLFEWIPRELNGHADSLANKAMDEEVDSVKLFTETPQDRALAAPIAEFNSEAPSSVRAPSGVTEPLTTVILVRHGRTKLTESKRISGRGGANPELSEAGIQDAKAAAQELGKIGKSSLWSHLPKIDAVVASPIARTQQTAKIIAEQLDVAVSTNDDIAEISFGAWDGLTHDEAETRDPAIWKSWQGSWQVSPPGGESLETFDQRVSDGITAIVTEHAGKCVVVVSHVMPIRGFLKRALEAGVSAYWRPQIAPCSITILRFWGNQAAETVVLNSTAHL